MGQYENKWVNSYSNESTHISTETCKCKKYLKYAMIAYICSMEFYLRYIPCLLIKMLVGRSLSLRVLYRKDANLQFFHIIEETGMTTGLW